MRLFISTNRYLHRLLQCAKISATRTRAEIVAMWERAAFAEATPATDEDTSRALEEETNSWKNSWNGIGAAVQSDWNKHKHLLPPVLLGWSDQMCDAQLECA